MPQTRTLLFALTACLLVSTFVALGHRGSWLWYLPAPFVGLYMLAALLQLVTELVLEHRAWKIAVPGMLVTAVLVGIGVERSFLGWALALPVGVGTLFALQAWWDETPSWEPDYDALQRPAPPRPPRPPLPPVVAPVVHTHCLGCGQQLTRREARQGGVCASCYAAHLASD